MPSPPGAGARREGTGGVHTSEKKRNGEDGVAARLTPRTIQMPLRQAETLYAQVGQIGQRKTPAPGRWGSLSGQGERGAIPAVASPSVAAQCGNTSGLSLCRYSVSPAPALRQP